MLILRRVFEMSWKVMKCCLLNLTKIQSPINLMTNKLFFSIQGTFRTIDSESTSPMGTVDHIYRVDKKSKFQILGS